MRLHSASGLWERSSWLIVGKIGLLVFLACSIIILSACSVRMLIQDEKQQDTSVSVEEATLQCSDECRARGQCGRELEGGDVVFLSSPAPALANHSAAYEANTPITIVAKEVHSVVQVDDGESLEMSFYSVVLPDGEQGWVPGWCLGY
ncbi:MAG TPA: hypothetical protein VFI27_07135 [candidate division Zixibacteria bacterium]|nr:hypothetical protein [candidate division Zixibacteria bacterium]